LRGLRGRSQMDTLIPLSVEFDDKMLGRIEMLGIGSGVSKFCIKGHISYYTTVRGPDILRNLIISGYLTFHQINTFFVNILFFHY